MLRMLVQAQLPFSNATFHWPVAYLLSAVKPAWLSVLLSVPNVP